MIDTYVQTDGGELGRTIQTYVQKDSGELGRTIKTDVHTDGGDLGRMIKTYIQTESGGPAIRLTGSEWKDVGKETEMAEWPTIGDSKFKEKATDEHTDRLDGAVLQDKQIYR